MELSMPFVFAGEDPFLHWVNQHVVKEKALDDFSFSKIALAAQKEFPDLEIDGDMIRAGLTEIARLKNFMEWPGSDFWH